MARLEVQGIVSSQTGMPLVQLRQFNDDGIEEVGFQLSPDQAREVAHNILEAATNAIYDAALILWANETWPEDELMGARMVALIRDHRADHWGLPDQPKDWTKD